MTEYAMAKASGEVLCADLQSLGKLGRIVVRRLPRLPTDQTAAIFDTETVDPVDTIISVVREMQASSNERPDVL
jgi:hypothetical protein